MRIESKKSLIMAEIFMKKIWIACYYFVGVKYVCMSQWVGAANKLISYIF